jgi:hypothetical protein
MPAPPVTVSAPVEVELEAVALLVEMTPEADTAAAPSVPVNVGEADSAMLPVPVTEFEENADRCGARRQCLLKA